MKRIYIYGAGGHGSVVADIADACGYEEVIFIDDGDDKYRTFEEIKKDCNIPLALGIGNNKTREKIFKKVQTYGFNVVSLIHPSAVVSRNVVIGKGTVVMPQVVINAKSRIGEGVILNSGCIVEHDNTIEDFVHISPGVALAGNVSVGKYTHIGIGARAIHGIDIGCDVTVGAGAVVIRDIPDRQKVVGVPAKKI